MVVHLHSSCWNEARMLPYYFRHYDEVVDHFFIHDNASDDESLAICAAHPRVTVLPLVLEGDSVCQSAFEQVNEFWHGSRGAADWTAVCNIDEFFWVPGLRGYLEKCRADGVSYIPSRGYQMVSEKFPGLDDDLARTIRTGVWDPHFGKPSFFNPDAITDSGFGMARHSAEPKGEVVIPDEQEMMLLHYKYIGWEYLEARHAELHARMRERDREKKWGYHYDPELTRRDYERFLAEAVEVVPAGAG
ncbi:MAG: glycosyltransferase family 2 protein [Verrucomicrobiota bacterium]